MFNTILEFIDDIGNDVFYIYFVAIAASAFFWLVSNIVQFEVYSNLSDIEEKCESETVMVMDQNVNISKCVYYEMFDTEDDPSVKWRMELVDE